MITQKLVDAIIQVESGGNDWAIGDRTLQYSAYGPMQIRWPCVSDVNKMFGTSYRAKQCLGDRAVSLDIFIKYMEIYANRGILGFEPTNETYARCWNGGPKGYKNKSTVAYWNKVKKYL
jgi:hypothetical protein